MTYSDIKILLIEDCAEIRESISLIFDLHWPQVQLINAANGFEGVASSKANAPDLILLDLGLPDLDGLRVLREIRDTSQVPVIILTVRDAEMDKIRGLELGADDYIVKPFTHNELLNRINTVMHRGLRSIKKEASVIEPDMPLIDLGTGTVLRGGKTYKLSNTETSLLRYLNSNMGKSIRAEDILANVWGTDYTDCAEFLRAYVNRIQEKIEHNPENPRILTGANNVYSLTQALQNYHV